MKQSEDEGFHYFDFMDVGFIHKNSGRSRFLLQFGENRKQPDAGIALTGFAQFLCQQIIRLMP